MNLFAYGTLMDIEILAGITRCRPDRQAAVLSGYSRHPVRGEVYPALVEKEGGRVAGVLYLDLPESVWPCLDRFEGEMYRRVSESVIDRNGLALPAGTYFCRPGFRHLLKESEWSFEKFLKSGKMLFKDEYRGFNEVK